MKIAYFGDKLSHTYAAAVALYGSGGFSDSEFCGFDTLYDALESVRTGECEVAVVPIENSFEGTVAASEDALGELGLFIVRETVLKIEQKLIANGGVKLGDVKRVYSHPQALAQCSATLRKLLPNAKTVSVAYTSAGLDMLDGESAAIARAPKEGQWVLRENVADPESNCTRFLAVKANSEQSGEKVSVMFSAENKPGALLGVLELLRERGLNMTKIESRPAKKRMGQYVFYVDFLFGGTRRELSGLLGELDGKCEGIRFLGRYPEYKFSK